jgi:endo-1,4-beta-xylanase
MLNTTAAGTVVVTATIANGATASTAYTQDCSITVSSVPSNDFVAVTGISGIPTAATAGTALSLTGTVAPATATNQTIVWSVKDAGTTGAAIASGNVLNTTAAGTVVVTAIIANGATASTAYTQDCSITVSDTFVAVTDIIGVLTVATAGTPFSLTGTVVPTTATNQTIAWSVKTAGTTKADIDSDNVLTTEAAGTVVVTATIANGATASTNYTKDYIITVSGQSANFVKVEDITDGPTATTVGATLFLDGTVTPANATNKAIVWTLKAGTTGAILGATLTDGNALNTTVAGSVTVIATIINGEAAGTPYTKEYTITVGAAFVRVTGINNVPTIARMGIALSLTGATVEPSNATNKAIVWSVKDAGTTSATIASGNVLNATATGTVVVTATVARGATASTPYTKDYTITVGLPEKQIYIGFNYEKIEITGSDGTNAISKTPAAAQTPPNSKPTSLTLNASDEYTNVAWYVDGDIVPVEIPEVDGDTDTTTVTLNAEDYAVQIHSVTFTGKRDGVLYSQVIPFTVLN